MFSSSFSVQGHCYNCFEWFSGIFKKKKPAESCIYEKIITKMGYSMLKKKVLFISL